MTDKVCCDTCYWFEEGNCFYNYDKGYGGTEWDRNGRCQHHSNLEPVKELNTGKYWTPAEQNEPLGYMRNGKFVPMEKFNDPT